MGALTDSVRGAMRPLLRRLPSPVQGRVRSAVERFVRRAGSLPAPEAAPLPGSVNWGDLRRLTPFSRMWGFDRGTPIDRFYIEEFLAAHAPDIRGAALEIMSADYTRRFGAERVSSVDVLDIDPANTAATVVADLCEADSLPRERFDCIVFTQTLHIVTDMRAAIANLWRALRPRGVLLITAPAVSRHDRGCQFHRHRWRITQAGIEWLGLELPGGHVEVTTYGNVFTCAAFLYGVAAEELRGHELRTRDPEFPVIVAALIRKREDP
jgi:SAM-dependent methyltransferase